jgi:hypothetical protein
MSEQDLRGMIDYASKFCERQFAKKGVISPMWHAVMSSGEWMYLPGPRVSKDLAVALIRATFETNDVVRYVFIDEAWTLVKKDIGKDELAQIDAHGLRDHPGRVEVVMISAEDCDTGMFMAQRRIIRPARGRPYLDKLEMMIDPTTRDDDGAFSSEGRMTGLLPKRGTRQ